MWVVAVTLLFMGGLLHEKASGASSFTLALPVSRARLMGVRIGAGLIEALVLVVVPWAAVLAVAERTGPAHPIAEVGLYALLLAGGGAVLAGAALLVASLVEGEYTAPLVSLGVVFACFNAPQPLDTINPLAFIAGRDYFGPSFQIAGPVPWLHLCANLGAASILIAISVRIIQRRDF